MEYGTIPSIDKPVSRLVQGTMMISSADRAHAYRLLDETFEQGCTAYDSAHVYGGGDCEKTLGDWVRERGLRHRVVIITKGAHPYNGRQRVTPADIDADLTDSLARLQTDYIDLYLLHRDDPTVPVGPIVEALNAQQRAGRITAFGASNWTTARLREANEYAAAHGLTPFAASSPNFSLAEQVVAPWEGCTSVGGANGEPDRAWYRATGMPLLAWSSLAGGFFSGRFRRDNLHTFQDTLDALCAQVYGSEANFRRLDRARTLAEQQGATLPQIAMAYVLNQPMNIFAIVGSRTGEEFRQNAAAADIRLSEQALAWLDLQTEQIDA